jgi:hypothetical protein
LLDAFEEHFDAPTAAVELAMVAAVAADALVESLFGEFVHEMGEPYGIPLMIALQRLGHALRSALFHPSSDDVA